MSTFPPLVTSPLNLIALRTLEKEKIQKLVSQVFFLVSFICLDRW